MEKKIFSLLEVTQSIQKTLTERYTSSFWVKAEMNKLNYYPHSGHCYPDLVEKKDGKVIAQIKSTLWRDDYARVNKSFLRVLKTPLKDGVNMLFCARITFDPAHGLALRIIDIDPAFSLGELEREKQEAIEKLKAEMLFDRNRSLKLPLVPQRIAVISVETSKGYADFKKVLHENPWGYKFFQVLFPSVLQGERAVESMGYQLDRIKTVSSHFDVVAIIRGGGGDVGLSCFNDFHLSRKICLFPIPVITGIGHATNETVVEMVAHKNAITPTDLANYLLDRFHDFSEPVHRAEEKIVETAQRMIREENMRFDGTIKLFRSVTNNVLIRNRHRIENNSRSVFQHSNEMLNQAKESHAAMVYQIRSDALAFCNNSKQELKQLSFSLKKDLSATFKEQTTAVNNLEKSVENMRPEKVLQRGYSITMINGKVVKSIQDVGKSDIVNTLLVDGQILSEVKSVEKIKDNE
jgi:exodeoxyribonuclease VII large subunit